MVREEIVSGLRQAISKGESLEKAMTSFYNSGYSKADIEEAASFLQTPQPQQYPVQQQPRQYSSPQQSNPETPKPIPKPQQQPSQSIPQPQQSSVLPQQQPQQYYLPQQQNFKPLPPPASSGVVQRVSEYGNTPRRGGKAITITLSILLILLLLILGAVIFYKDELSTFLTNLFWRALF